LDEFFEVLTLEQTQRIPRYPMILFGRDYWQGLFRWMKGTLEKNQFISPGDIELCTLTDDPQEAVAIILDYLRRVGPPETIPKTLS
jgi:predicted Rossmann-fold nucleotide-binding protein